MAAPRRKVGRGPQRKSFLVLVEGEVTEADYLLYWKRRLRLRVQVDVPDFHGTPLSLVEKAVELKAEEERMEKRGRGRMHDEYWCVFDIDTHPNVPEAIELARANGIALAISNPCIELWFLLHFTEHSAYIECADAARSVKAKTGAGKSISPDGLEQLSERFETAKERARRLEAKHRGDGTPAPGNPSSGAWRLIDAMQMAGDL